MENEYTIHTWSETLFVGPQIAARKTYRGAHRYAEAHAYEYANGLYVMRPDGLCDDGVELIARDGARAPLDAAAIKARA